MSYLSVCNPSAAIDAKYIGTRQASQYVTIGTRIPSPVSLPRCTEAHFNVQCTERECIHSLANRQGCHKPSLQNNIFNKYNHKTDEELSQKYIVLFVVVQL